MLVISTNYALSPAAAAADPDLPAIGWLNTLDAGSVTADAEDANYPASNLTNPATHLEWRSDDDTEQYLFFALSSLDPIDYVGIAKHNFASAEIPVSVEINDGSDWVEVVQETVLPDDGPVVFRFEPVTTAQLRIRLQAGSVPPRAAVVYVGKLLDLERKIYVGHVPMPDGIKSNIANNRSESGNYLGRIVLGEWRESTVPLSLITPAWFRTKMRPFLKGAKETPFFFAWRPFTYPREVGYGWLMDDPAPAPVGPSNLLAFDLKISGIA